MSMDGPRVKVPTSLNEEDPFLSMAEIKLSLRQLLTILLTGLAWMLLTQLTQFLLPVNAIFAAIIWSWTIFAGLFLTFWKKDGRPYEEYLSKYYDQQDPLAKYGNVEDADWSEINERENSY
jgi:PrgI family protein